MNNVWNHCESVILDSSESVKSEWSLLREAGHFEKHLLNFFNYLVSIEK